MNRYSVIYIVFWLLFIALLVWSIPAKPTIQPLNDDEQEQGEPIYEYHEVTYYWSV